MDFDSGSDACNILSLKETTWVLPESFEPFLHVFSLYLYCDVNVICSSSPALVTWFACRENWRHDESWGSQNIPGVKMPPSPCMQSTMAVCAVWKGVAIGRGQVTTDRRVQFGDDTSHKQIFNSKNICEMNSYIHLLTETVPRQWWSTGRILSLLGACC